MNIFYVQLCMLMSAYTLVKRMTAMTQQTRGRNWDYFGINGRDTDLPLRG